ncbi:MAG: tetratricopeptide repeat protein, partial [Candidatus Omnitrophota bacterium]
MNRIKQETILVSLFQKILLLFSSIVFTFIFIESGLRLGEAVFESVQKQRNLSSMKQGGAYRIICLGESTTALGEKNSYPSQMEKILNGYNLGIKFSVINKGRPSCTTSGIIENLEKDIERYKPDMVVVMMGINDDMPYLSYKDHAGPRYLLYLESLKTCKLFRLLWTHTRAKYSDIRAKFSKKYKELSSLNPSFYMDRPKYCFADETDTKALARQGYLTYVEQGISYKNHGQYAKAEEAFKKALELDPENDWLCIGLAEFYQKEGKYTQAERLFEKATEINPDSDWLYVKFGWFYASQGKYTQAEKLFRKALNINPKNDWAYVSLGNSYLSEGKYALSKKAFIKAIKINPRNERASLELGNLYRAQENYPLFEKFYKKALELDPKNEGVYIELGRYYLNQKQYAKAE